jgi:hypothetical protein
MAAGLSRFRPGFRRAATDNNDQSVIMKDGDSAQKTPETDTKTAALDEVDNDGRTAMDRPDEDAQRGVRMVEAVTLTWSKKALIAVFIK